MAAVGQVVYGGVGGSRAGVEAGKPVRKLVIQLNDNGDSDGDTEDGKTRVDIRLLQMIISTGLVHD